MNSRLAILLLGSIALACLVSSAAGQRPAGSPAPAVLHPHVHHVHRVQAPPVPATANSHLYRPTRPGVLTGRHPPMTPALHPMHAPRFSSLRIPLVTGATTTTTTTTTAAATSVAPAVSALNATLASTTAAPLPSSSASSSSSSSSASSSSSSSASLTWWTALAATGTTPAATTTTTSAPTSMLLNSTSGASVTVSPAALASGDSTTLASANGEWSSSTALPTASSPL